MLPLLVNNNTVVFHLPFEEPTILTISITCLISHSSSPQPLTWTFVCPETAWTNKTFNMAYSDVVVRVWLYQQARATMLITHDHFDFHWSTPKELTYRFIRSIHLVMRFRPVIKEANDKPSQPTRHKQSALRARTLTVNASVDLSKWSI